MDFPKARAVFRAVFLISTVGWVVFGLFLAPDDFTVSQLPIARAFDPHSFWSSLLLFGSILTPIAASCGWIVMTILIVREQGSREATIEWEIE